MRMKITGAKTHLPLSCNETLIAPQPEAGLCAHPFYTGVLSGLSLCGSSVCCHSSSVHLACCVQKTQFPCLNPLTGFYNQFTPASAIISEPEEEGV